MRFFPKSIVRLNLALQGGGAHGAFTWGVLDALLEDGSIGFDGVSATSAGAMNAGVLAQGWLDGGREGAREALERFWTAVAASAPFDSQLLADPGTGALAPGVRMLLAWTRHFGPHQLNPFGVNPLRRILEAQVDFDRLRTASPLRLFVAATHANSGRLRLFRNDELSADVLLASACLPSIHHPIEIDGEHYWDGAFSANPAVYPLFYDCAADDTMLVLLSPVVHGKTPKTAAAVHTRSLELAFNAAFLREMAAFAHARHQVARARWPRSRFDRQLLRARFHLIEADAVVGKLAAESRLTTSLAFLTMLRDTGRAEAREWLAAHRRDLGRRSSLDIEARFG